MDFFGHQEAARRRSRRRVVLFAAAVAGIVLAVYLAVTVLLAGALGAEEGFEPRLWDPGRLSAVSAAVLAVVGLGSLWKTAQLRGGGARIAEQLGGRRVEPATTSPDERRLLNVVEEMALASGVPVPTVYLLERELGINAFAAGHSPSDAVVAVTRGAMLRLRRDELQGVVAHEFSHLLNGDMRLNLRLMGLLHGILVIALIGEILLRTSRFSGSGSGRGKKGGGAPIVLFGLALYLIGWIGIFFGRLIKAGVSRQREFLADASAVQFTRDPGGIAGALKKIGAVAQGSRLLAARAEEASHLYFADGLAGGWLESLSTHPPLADRIRRIEPGFDGLFPKLPPLEEELRRPPLEPATPSGLERVAGLAAASVAAGSLAASAGEVRRAQLDRALELLAAVPVGVREALREPPGARAVVCALLIESGEPPRAAQLARIGREPEPDLAAWVARIDEALPADRTALRLPLLDLALPALRRSAPPDHARFRALCRELAAADPRTSLAELALERSLERHLDPHFGAPPAVRTEVYSLRGRQAECSILLSAIARAAQPDEVAAASAFAAGAGALAARGVELRLVTAGESSAGTIAGALDRLRSVAPPWQKALLEAAELAAAHDLRLDPQEAELLRIIADALGVPLPPPAPAGA